MKDLNQKKLLLISTILGVIAIIAIIATISTQLSNDKEKDFFIGDYSTAPGGETRIKLSLHEDGGGVIIFESWTDTGYIYESLAKSEVQWNLRNNRLVLVYENLYDVFQYKTDYDLTTFGEKGRATGLLQTFPIHEESWISGNFLYKEKDKKTVEN